jgi:hypothetical protein
MNPSSNGHQPLLPVAAGRPPSSIALLCTPPATAASSVVPVAAHSPYNPTAKTTEPDCLWIGELRVGSDSPAGLGGHPGIRY